MKRLLRKIRFCLLSAIVLMAAGNVFAPNAFAQSKGYGRMMFSFSQPAKLNASSSGTTATLQFDKPVNESPGAIEAKLAGYVTKAQLSADKRTVTLTLTKPYRIRQFVSGAGVGVDFVGTPDAAPVEAKKEDPILSTKKPELVKPAPEVKKEKPATPVKAAENKAQKPIEEAKKPEPKKESSPKVSAAAPIEPVAVEKPDSKSAEDPILSTKHNVPTAAAAEAMLSTKHNSAPVAAPTTKPAAEEKTAAPAAKPDPILTTKHTPEKPSATTAAETLKPVTTSEEKASAPIAKATASSAFIVGARNVNGDTVINFPWGERTAATVFKRAREIWIVFSRPKDVNVKLLRTVMPKAVINVTQYAYPGNTVLRLTTDGSVQPSVAQSAGGYGWDVTLGPTATHPVKDIPITTDSLQGTMRLVLAVFDVGTPLRFFDPNVGDEVIIVPTYETGRGIATGRNYPEFSVLDSAQGVAIASRRDDLVIGQTRSGFIVSAKDGLSISDSLPVVQGTTPLANAAATGVMMPYAEWFVPADKFLDTLMERQRTVANATKATKPDAMLEVVKLYLSQGQCAEANGWLQLIKTDFPQYYITNKLALYNAVCNVMADRIPEANASLAAPELLDLEETALWREVTALYAPPVNTVQQVQQDAEEQAITPKPEAPAEAATTATAAPTESLHTAPEAAAAPTIKLPTFHYLKFNKTIIRYYPPRIRQRLAIIASDAYLADGQEEKALAVFDTLLRDNILDPVKKNAEFALGAAARKKGETDKALEIFDRLAHQSADRYIAARARYAWAMLAMKANQIPPEVAANVLENTRLTWRGDALEHDILNDLAILYKNAHRYDDVLRTKKTMLESFPNDPQAIKIAGDMTDLYSSLFLDGLADDMPPLKALSLFYEFRELIPIGPQGDMIVQKLADRLAAIDLLDRATQLLEHQIKFRTTAEVRSQVGARLALLHLLNHRPQEALSVLEVTNYGGNSPELKIQRQELTAEALMKVGKNEEALSALYTDTTKAGTLLRLDVLWAMGDWPNVVNTAEDIMDARPNLTDPLTTQETAVLLKLALGYCFQGDYTQLRYLRDYYSGLIPDSAYKQIFDFITNDTNPLDPEDFAMLAGQISRTESFLDTFKAKIAAGKLSEAIQ